MISERRYSEKLRPLLQIVHERITFESFDLARLLKNLARSV